ncbi:hypothetical protein VSVS12_04023 [Vibrio scophthalmi]|uniref:hypothetical protein n=1 Tax=Vibrio scophthalmi TaxID=45658 RepID=UPI000809294F|nr:hypothetical protein [Vibrio scophthalmi]ANS87723.1 hypothetical protein VSVS12_04023 [Vibrio scophthalmi]
MLITDALRLDIIQALDETTSYASQQDISRYLVRGLSPVDIGLIEMATTLLRTEPYLQEQDLIDQGIGKQHIKRILGGVEHFKSLLGLEDYCFADYLRDQKLDISSGVTIPYFIYQVFSDDIRRDYVSPDNPPQIVSTLNIEIEAGYQLNTIPILGKLYTQVPATDVEMMVVSFGLLLNDYHFVDYEMTTSILTLKAKSRDHTVDIEVRCFASQFKTQTEAGICVIDDSFPMKNHQCKKRVLSLKQLIERVHNQ